MQAHRRLVKLLNSLADINRLSMLSVDEHLDLLRTLDDQLCHLSLEDSEIRQELCGIAAIHPSPWVRYHVLCQLAPFSKHEDIRELLVWLTHDPEDFVIFKAVHICEQYRVQEAAGDLMMLIGLPSKRLLGKNGKPVGLGHIVVLKALIAILGTDDPLLLQQREDEVKPPMLEKELPELRPENNGPGTCNCALHDHQGMVKIPGGAVHMKVPPAFDRQCLLFDWDEVLQHEQVIDVGAFWMDIYPVTCQEYDAFSASDAARDHRFCHPAEPPNKLHVRNTLLDRRFGTDHPATGVDWFDAYAYAASVGKRLPTEWEWQRAAQGDDQRAYPWGDAFDSSRCRWLGEVMQCRIDSVSEWRDALYRLFLTEGVSTLTVTVKKLENVSPYGIIGLSGNCWEWTATNSVTGQGLSPQVNELDLAEITKDWQSYPTIRGGAWSALPEMASVAFRGRDLLTDRHFENGFRCMCSGT